MMEATMTLRVLRLIGNGLVVAYFTLAAIMWLLP
jgi:hypothetical protein